MTTQNITNVKLPILSRSEIFDYFEHFVFFIHGKVYDMQQGWLLDQLTQLKLVHNVHYSFDNHSVVQLTKDRKAYKKLLGESNTLIKIFADYSAVKGYYDIQKTIGKLDLSRTTYQLLHQKIPFTCEGGKEHGTIIFVQDAFMYILKEHIWIKKTFGITPYNYNSINLNQKLNLEGFYV